MITVLNMKERLQQHKTNEAMVAIRYINAL